MTRFAASVAALLAVLALAGCGGDDGGDDGGGRESLRVGYTYGEDVGDVGDHIAFERLSERENVDVETRDLGGTANAFVALKRGDVDLVNIPYTAAADAVAQGAKVKIVLGANIAVDFVFVAREGITDARQLRGKRVAYTSAGGNHEEFTKDVVRDAGVPLSSVKFSALRDSSARAAALASGRLDATLLEYPDYAQVRKRKPGIRILADLADHQPAAASQVWLVSAEAAETRADFIQRVVTGLLDGYEYVYTDEGRDEWVERALATVLEDEPTAFAEELYDHYRTIAFWPRRDEPITRAQHDRAVRYWVEQDEVERAVSYEEVWAPSFWEEAAA